MTMHRNTGALVLSALLAVPITVVMMLDGADRDPTQPTSAPAPEAPADNPAPAEGNKPPQEKVRELGDGKFALGLVTFDQNTREISFPASINMDEGLLEYAITHENGKTHETLLVTKVSPTHLNVALKLLRYPESKELEMILDEDFRPTGKFPNVPKEIKNAARVSFIVTWKDKNKEEKKASINTLITNSVTGEPIAPLPWVYGGSYFHDGTFRAEVEGDIAALFSSAASLFNWPGDDRHLDRAWVPTPERVPEFGTPVTVTIKPFIKPGGP